MDVEDERVTGGGALFSSDPNGFRLLIVVQPAMLMARAIAASFRPLFRRFLSGDIIDGCSIIVVSVCPWAGVAVICRVGAARAAKRVTISAQKRVCKPKYYAALSAILFNKVKNLGAICRNSH